MLYHFKLNNLTLERALPNGSNLALKVKPKKFDCKPFYLKFPTHMKTVIINSLDDQLETLAENRSFGKVVETSHDGYEGPKG